jgi:predicted O-methyltransferase YrrM
MSDNRWETPWGMTREQLLAKWEHVLEWTDHIFTWTSPSELCFLAEAASRASNGLEIGSYHAKSALAMMLANPNMHLTCIDNCENPEVPRIFRKNMSEQIKARTCRFVENTSKWLLANPGQFDLVWIDAGHLEPDVTDDIKNSLPQLAPGGLICGHDWRINNMEDGVNVAVLKAFGRPKTFESIWWIPPK